MLVREEWVHRNENVRVRIWRDGQIYRTEFLHNLIVDSGLNHARDLLAGVIFDGEIKHMEIGSGTAAPDPSQTDLVTPVFRKAVTSQTPGVTGEVTTTTFIGTAEGNFQIEELGWFAGTNSDLTLGSGTMIARVLFSHLKTVQETIQVDRQDSF